MVQGMLGKAVAEYYATPVKNAIRKFITEKGAVKRIMNGINIPVTATAPYIDHAASLAKTPMGKTTAGLTAAFIPIFPEIKKSYEASHKVKDILMQNYQNFSITGAIAGTILGGAIGGVPGAVVGGIALDMYQNKKKEEKEKAKQIMNEYIMYTPPDYESYIQNEGIYE